MQMNTSSSMSSKKRSILLREAHLLKPAVLVGKQGLTEGVVQAVRESLDRHELVKIKFNDFKENKRELLESIVRQTDAETVSVIGNVGIIYRRNEDPSKRVYHGIPLE